MVRNYAKLNKRVQNTLILIILIAKKIETMYFLDTASLFYLGIYSWYIIFCKQLK